MWFTLYKGHYHMQIHFRWNSYMNSVLLYTRSSKNHVFLGGCRWYNWLYWVIQEQVCISAIPKVNPMMSQRCTEPTDKAMCNRWYYIHNTHILLFRSHQGKAAPSRTSANLQQYSCITKVERYLSPRDILHIYHSHSTLQGKLQIRLLLVLSFLFDPQNAIQLKLCRNNLFQ